MHYTFQDFKQQNILGILKFKPGESQAVIKIPLLNDPSGKKRHFVVNLDEVEGRDNVGDRTSSKVVVANKAS